MQKSFQKHSFEAFQNLQVHNFENFFNDKNNSKILSQKSFKEKIDTLKNIFLRMLRGNENEIKAQKESLESWTKKSIRITFYDFMI